METGHRSEKIVAGMDLLGLHLINKAFSKLINRCKLALTLSKGNSLASFIINELPWKLIMWQCDIRIYFPLFCVLKAFCVVSVCSSPSFFSLLSVSISSLHEPPPPSWLEFVIFYVFCVVIV